MTQNLNWRPKYSSGKSLSDQLKFILRDKGMSHYTFTSSNIPYLEGLFDAGVKDAKKLIDAINKHEYVEVYEE